MIYAQIDRVSMATMQSVNQRVNNPFYSAPLWCPILGTLAPCHRFSIQSKYNTEYNTLANNGSSILMACEFVCTVANQMRIKVVCIPVYSQKSAVASRREFKYSVYIYTHEIGHAWATHIDTSTHPVAALHECGQSNK